MEANTPTNLTPRTVLEWLGELPEPYRAAALHNSSAAGFQTLAMKTNSVKDAVWLAFDWFHTVEGGRYWVDLCAKLTNGEIQLTEPKKDVAVQQPMQGAESKSTPKLRPRRDWVHERVKEIVGAMSLKLAACEPIPVEWAEELNDHVFELWPPLVNEKQDEVSVSPPLYSTPYTDAEMFARDIASVGSTSIPTVMNAVTEGVDKQQLDEKRFSSPEEVYKYELDEIRFRKNLQEMDRNGK